MPTLQRLPSALDASGRESANGGTKADDGSMLRDMQMITVLLERGQILCQKTPADVVGLCNEVARITNGRAHLQPGSKGFPCWQRLPPHTLLTIPVQFGNISYGVLCITCDSVHTDLPSIASPVAQLFAQACSWLLHTFEQSVFLQGQYRQFEYQVCSPLTKCEQKVIQLMYQGYNREEIASLLNISPATLRKHRQHIYERLGVHNEHDALLVAYHAGLLSLFNEEFP